MGSGLTISFGRKETKEFEVREEIAGQGDDVLRFSRKIHLPDTTLNDLFTIFKGKELRDKPDFVSLEAFFAAHDVKNVEFAKILFLVKEPHDEVSIRSVNRVIDFTEYLISLWSFLT
jgi:hypothetical protein